MIVIIAVCLEIFSILFAVRKPLSNSQIEKNTNIAAKAK
jgi:hypothetical protein